MPKIQAFVRNLRIVAPLLTRLNEACAANEGSVGQPAPGQVWKRGEWYALTYMKTQKIKDFEPTIMEYKEREISSIRAVHFMIVDNRILISGSKKEIDEIGEYFRAQSLTMVEEADRERIDFTKFFSMDMPVVCFQNLLERLENEGKISDVKKMKIKNVQIKLGKVPSCMVNTADYGAVRKQVTEEADSIQAMDLPLKEQAKTSVYFDIDAQIRIKTKKSDLNMDEMLLTYSQMI